MSQSDKEKKNVSIGSPEMQETVAPYALEPSDDPELTECYITESGAVTSQADLWKSKVNMPSASLLQTVEKSVASGSTQDDTEYGGLRESSLQGKVVEPPYDASILAKFLEVDEAHFRCVKTKVIDSVGRAWDIQPVSTESGDVYDPSKLSVPEQESIKKEIQSARRFIEDCNDILSFEGVLERVAMDHEAVGWGAIEVIRSRDMKIAKLAHVPASRIKVLKGWKGFVEATSNGGNLYYQQFGRKVVSTSRIDPLTGEPSPYNPREDGELDPKSTLEWNLINRKTGEPTNSLDNAANEIIWIPKHHSNSIYYGYPDIIPALGDVLGNVYIRDYMLQFFEHNTIPQYAVIIEGAKVAEPVKKMIQEYFSQEVKGQAHKTLIIPLPATGGEVRVRFEKLAADKQEGSFQDVRKNNQQGILTAHGVSPAIIGINETASLGSGKGLSQAEIYKDRIVTPMQAKWERLLNKLFRLGLGVTQIGIKFQRLDIRDLELEMKVLTEYYEKGLLTVNEVRGKAALGDGYEGGDRAFFVANGLNMVFVDELEDESFQINSQTQQVRQEDEE